MNKKTVNKFPNEAVRLAWAAAFLTYDTRWIQQAVRLGNLERVKKQDREIEM